jgi:hypothetical protein
MPLVGPTLRRSKSFSFGADEIGRTAVFATLAFLLRITEFSLVGVLNGMEWMGRGSLWPLLARSAFVIAVAYVTTFIVWKTKFPWLVAGVVCGLLEILISIPYFLRDGTTWQSIALPVVEWFLVGSIATLVAMLVPADWPDKTKSRKTYY